MTVKTSSLPKWFHKHICEMMSSLKRCFPSILWGAECFLNCLSSARLDHADFCDFFFEEMKHLGYLDPKLFNQHLDVFHLSGEIPAFILWWTVSKITCWKYSAFFFSFSFFISLPFLFQNVGKFWCAPMFSHQTISGWDYIEPEPNLTKSVEKFQWYLSEAANSWGHLAWFKRRVTLHILSGALEIFCWEKLK